MFLHVLKDDAKKKFLELVYKVATCDNEYAEDEEEIINSYKAELGVSEIGDTGTIAELVQYFSEEDKELRRILFFEIYGLIIVDEKRDEAEEAILQMMRESFRLSDQECAAMAKAAEQLQEAYDAVYAAIFD